jgi:hypothetical protein
VIERGIQRDHTRRTGRHPDLDAWTAGGLRAELPSTLPAPGAEFFIRAGAIVAERLATASRNPALVDAALRRAAQQAGQLLHAGNAAAAWSTK